MLSTLRVKTDLKIIFFLIGAILSVILNLMVVIVTCNKYKRNRLNHMDMLMLSLAVSDILQASTGYPLEISSYLSRRVISTTVCKIAGFSVTFLALVSISHLVGISVERFLISYFPLRARKWFANGIGSAYIIIPSWLYGLIWAIFPLLGWSGFKREANARHRCSIDLSNPTQNARSYAYCILVFCFVIPVSIIMICSTLIVTVLKKMTRQASVLGMQGEQACVRRRREVRHTIMAFVLIAVFLVSWTPYALCVFVKTRQGSIDDSLLTTSALLAKTSTLYNPIIYTVFLKDFRCRLRRLCGFPPVETTPTVMTITRKVTRTTTEATN